MGDKTEWPTQERLRELRDQGIFPYTPFFARCLLLSAFMLAFVLMLPAWRDLWGHYDALVENGVVAGVHPVETHWYKLLSLLSNLLLTLAALTILTFLTAVLGSSKFLFRFSFAAFNLTRMNMFVREGRGGIVAALALYIGAFVAALAAGVLVWWLYSAEVLELLNKQRQHFVAWPEQFVTSHLALWLAALLSIAALSWLINWSSFMLKHRMSRADLRAEQND
ncbi:MAG: EscU/YscU/HrcU family type III secretion system export apparatus switch protein [Deltaproteobacteria bacterium]|nr:EscU/YscU/HrcU family type III secretion system export apparatus switch protein [Deltaproteobacteria bacterium]